MLVLPLSCRLSACATLPHLSESNVGVSLDRLLPSAPPFLVPGTAQLSPAPPLLSASASLAPTQPHWGSRGQGPPCAGLGGRAPRRNGSLNLPPLLPRPLPPHPPRPAYILHQPGQGLQHHRRGSAHQQLSSAAAHARRQGEPREPKLASASAVGCKGLLGPYPHGLDSLSDMKAVNSSAINSGASHGALCL